MSCASVITMAQPSIVDRGLPPHGAKPAPWGPRLRIADLLRIKIRNPHSAIPNESAIRNPQSAMSEAVPDPQPNLPLGVEGGAVIVGDSRDYAEGAGGDVVLRVREHARVEDVPGFDS